MADSAEDPSRVMTALADVFWDRADKQRIAALMELCKDTNKTPRFLLFLYDLEFLCRRHGIVLTTNGHDDLQVWDAGVNNTIGLNVCGVQNHMKERNDG